MKYKELLMHNILGRLRFSEQNPRKEINISTPEFCVKLQKVKMITLKVNNLINISTPEFCVKLQKLKMITLKVNNFWPSME